MPDKLYQDFAQYYDVIYSEKNYREESEKLRGMVDRYKESEGRELLDVACGTGEHLKNLDEYFECTGIDINEGILDVAREKLEDIDFYQADMMEMDLNEKFDVITCLFSSIGYVRTKKNLEKTLEKFSSHLKRGGIAIVEPWFSEEGFIDGYVSCEEFEDDEVSLVRMSYSEEHGETSTTEMHYLIGREGGGVRYEREEHEMGLFSDDDVMEAMDEAGLNPVKVEGELELNRRTFVGIK